MYIQTRFAEIYWYNNNNNNDNNNNNNNNFFIMLLFKRVAKEIWKIQIFFKFRKGLFCIRTKSKVIHLNVGR